MKFGVTAASRDRLSVQMDRVVFSEVCHEIDLPISALGRLAVRFAEDQLLPPRPNKFASAPDVIFGTFSALVPDELAPFDQLIELDISSLKKVSDIGIRLPDYAYVPTDELFNTNVSGTVVHELFHFKNYLRKKELSQEVRDLKWHQFGRSRSLEWELKRYRPQSEERRVQLATNDLFTNRRDIFSSLVNVIYED